MTLNDLIKAIPPEYHDSIIQIYLPSKEDAETLPLIQVSYDDTKKGGVRVILEADYE